MVIDTETVRQEWIKVEADGYIYRAVHRIMEGDCQMAHGPVFVTVGPLMASKYTVTNHMYYEYIKASGYEPENKTNYLKHWKDGRYRDGEADLPVVNISQEDAKAYAGYYGGRLPTEAEWQYLAAGPEHLKWPWGNQKEYARCNVFSAGPEPVNTRREGVSPFGLHHMCGNVWEYTDEVLEDGDGEHRFLVLRGGSYYSGESYWHAESGAAPNDSHLKVHLLGGGMDRFETVGFRCVKEIRDDS